MPAYELRTHLGIDEGYRRHPTDHNAVLRRQALMVLAGLTLVVVIVIGWLAIDGKDIPDLLSGLAGSGIGAIAGILSGGGSSPPPPLQG